MEENMERITYVFGTIFGAFLGRTLGANLSPPLRSTKGKKYIKDYGKNQLGHTNQEI
jgi:hypothetical protein